jgi:hypothetical protein
MSVSERDREYMRQIGEAKAASIRPEDRDDDPRPFYDRARALGLYRP